MQLGRIILIRTLIHILRIFGDKIIIFSRIKTMLRLTKLSKEHLTIPTKKNLPTNNNDSELPWPFRDNFVGWWFVGFYGLIIYFIVAIATLNFPLISNYVGSNYLMSNIGILITTLTITMSITLLLIQFRAQSYTMIALIEQMKDKVVYYFIIIFMVLIITNAIIIIGLPKFTNVLLPFVFTFTIFAMIYLIRYIFHMIYGLQPSQIINVVIDNMKKYMGTTPVNKLGRNDEFDVWEQIMSRAVETNNTTLFNDGLGGLFSNYNRAIINSQRPDIGQQIENFFLLYAREVMLGCVRHGRESCAHAFMREFSKNDKIALHIDELKTHQTNMMLDVWSDMMEMCILHKEKHMIRYGMQSFDDQLEKLTKISDTTWTKVFLHNRISMLLNLAVTQNNTEYQIQYLNVVSKYNFPEIKMTSIPGTSLYMEPMTRGDTDDVNVSVLIAPSPTVAWTIIMNDALKRNDMSIFIQGINTMKKNLSMNNTTMKYKSMILALAELMKKVNDRNYNSIFLEYFAVMVFDVQIKEIWINTIEKMIKAENYTDVRKLLEQIADEWDNAIK